MHRIDAPGATAQNKFTEGDPVLDIPATVVDADWLNSVQEELSKVIEAAGLSLNNNKDDQLYKALEERDNARWPIGSLYFNASDSTNPGSFLPGTWAKYTEGYIYPDGAPDAPSAGTTFGENEHTLKASEVPKLTGDTNSKGSHNHTRGSMNIKGSFDSRASQSPGAGRTQILHSASGAFKDDGFHGFKANRVQISNVENSSGLVYKFDASRNWTGRTNSAGNHKHNVTVNAGGGEAHNNMPLSCVVYVWQRTA